MNKSYRTTIAGLLGITGAVATCIGYLLSQPGLTLAEACTAIGACFTLCAHGFGLMQAKDAAVTGLPGDIPHDVQ